MERYFAYFDFMGYKEFVMKNDDATLSLRSGHILRDLEMALARNKNKMADHGQHLVPDLSDSTLNCLNISDTIFLITNDNLLESLKELLEVSKIINSTGAFRTMPIRGAICYGEFNMRTARLKNDYGAIYSPNLMYGRVLVEGHIKAESQNWSGTVIDQSVVSKVAEVTDPNGFFDPYAKLYMIPYKIPPIDQQKEWALRLTDGGLNESTFENRKRNILESFSNDNKPVDDPRVQEKIKNTIQFLESDKE